MKSTSQNRRSARMTLLSKLDYLQLIGGKPRKVSAPVEQIPAILKYAQKVWPKLDLGKRELGPEDIATVQQHGQTLLYHLSVDAKAQPETFVIVAAEKAGDKPLGHILLDLAAESARPRLVCPTCQFEDFVEPGVLEHLLSQIFPDDEDPYAILELTDGTYMQTLCTEEGYVLEHQLVNTSSHYEIPDLITLEAVGEAMNSYAMHDNRWLTMFDWQKLDL